MGGTVDFQVLRKVSPQLFLYLDSAAHKKTQHTKGREEDVLGLGVKNETYQPSDYAHRRALVVAVNPPNLLGGQLLYYRTISFIANDIYSHYYLC